MSNSQANTLTIKSPWSNKYIFLKLPLVFPCNYQNKLVILKLKKIHANSFFPPIQEQWGKARWNWFRENNYISNKTHGFGHASIYKINYEHEQRIQKSGKQMSKNNGNKPALLNTSSSHLNRLEIQFPPLQNRVVEKIKLCNISTVSDIL